MDQQTTDKMSVIYKLFYRFKSICGFPQYPPESSGISKSQGHTERTAESWRLPTLQDASQSHGTRTDSEAGGTEIQNLRICRQPVLTVTKSHTTGKGMSRPWCWGNQVSHGED